jgi:type IV secretory pathway VirB3-like protein
MLNLLINNLLILYLIFLIINNFVRYSLMNSLYMIEFIKEAKSPVFHPIIRQFGNQDRRQPSSSYQTYQASTYSNSYIIHMDPTHPN